MQLKQNLSHKLLEARWLLENVDRKNGVYEPLGPYMQDRLYRVLNGLPIIKRKRWNKSKQMWL